MVSRRVLPLSPGTAVTFRTPKAVGASPASGPRAPARAGAAVGRGRCGFAKKALPKRRLHAGQPSRDTVPSQGSLRRLARRGGELAPYCYCDALLMPYQWNLNGGAMFADVQRCKVCIFVFKPDSRQTSWPRPTQPAAESNMLAQRCMFPRSQQAQMPALERREGRPPAALLPALPPFRVAAF